MIIKEIKNNLPKTTPLKERMSLFVPGINSNLPNRNGCIYAIIGSPGSGKSNLLFSTLFKNTNYYRSRFDNVFLITPESSFLSLSKHPFQDHEKVYHELSAEVLQTIYNEIMELKTQAIENGAPIEHSCIIVDDFASDLKDISIVNALKQMLIKSRHINTCFIFTLQSYTMFPMVLRKLITNMSLFKPKNNAETETVRTELLNMNKDDFLKLYNYVFDKPYNHLDYDTTTMEIRKNYNLLQIN
jgi:hypothetical protein